MVELSEQVNEAVPELKFLHKDLKICKKNTVILFYIWNKT